MPNGVASLPLIPFPARAADAPATRLSSQTRVVSAENTATEARLLASALSSRTGLSIDVGTDARPGDIVITLGPDDLDEGYSLRTGENVTVSATTPVGAYWGTRTLLQLLAQDADGWFVTGAAISDAPRFAYRGVMLDVARHFFTVEQVCAYIDMVSNYKINVLHLHLTDDQGWRLEIAGFENLTGTASATAANGDKGGYYTQADYTRIVEYAAERHITVVPEIDTPGHTHAVSVAYPEFAEQPVLNDALAEQSKTLNQPLPVFGENYTGWGVGFSSVKIGDEATDAFLDEVFRQVAALTPGPWVHLGGDECLGTKPEDFAAFVSRAAASIAETGKTPMAWHEAGKATQLPTGTVGQYWGFLTPQPGYADEARAFVTAGGSLVMSPADAAYLDMKYDADTRIGLTWANGPTSVEASYAWDPTAVIEGVTDEHILGVEAPLWTETVVTLDDIAELVFPRLPGLAEIGWSQADAPERTWASLKSRLAAHAPTWKAEGINFHPSEEIA